MSNKRLRMELQSSINCNSFLNQIIDKLRNQIEGFWSAVYHSYLIETREEIEKDCKESWAEGTSPMAVAAHSMWKRKPRVKKLEDALKRIILLNRQTAKDKYGDAEKAEEWACVKIARNALNNPDY